ncbi:hypothetical protein Tco_1004602 [Tanacetum coccineum]|uniref:Uncharacterized protein n=1 Tax=Tanacetum coccineum TaxID=301880 RepID=A0ABQ5FDH1_9ASTR
MRRQEKDFSRTVTPLFATMLIQPQANVGEDKTVHKERGDSMERAATTAASLDAEQDSGSVPRRQDTILGDRPVQTRVLALENVKTAQDLEITSLNKRGRHDQDIDVTTVSAPITIAGVSVSTAEPSTPPTTTTVIEDEDLTIAQTLMKMSESGTRKALPPSQHDLKNKGKAKMIEPEKPLKKKDHIKFDEEVAKRLAGELEAGLEEEERVTIQREEEDNLISCDNTQAMMEADYELA